VCRPWPIAARAEQLGLIRAHPELAGKAMVSKSLTAESTNEQNKGGLTDCTPEEFAKIQQLNAGLQRQVRLPFILAVRGPARHRPGQARDHRHLRAPAATTTTDFELGRGAAETSTASREIPPPTTS
jgi:OHCU decarboxylase